MRVGITGANGFIGSHFVRYLLKRGIDVVAFVRPNADCKFIEKTGAKIVHTEYGFGFEKKLDELDILVHNAALASDWGDLEKFNTAHQKLTRDVYDAAKIAGLKKIVQISSIAVMGEEDSVKPKGLDQPYNPVCPYFCEELFPSGMNEYRVQKTATEKFAREFCKKSEISLVVLRPAWVFGPREFNAGPFEYCKTILEGIPLMPGVAHNYYHPLYVEDLADALYKTLFRFHSQEEIFIIGSEHVPTMKEFYLHFCTNIKKKFPINVHPDLLILPVFLIEVLWTLLKIKTPPLLTRARLYMFKANNIYDVSHSKKILNYHETPLDLAVRKTVKWWRLGRFL